jgi:hypothetical protein
VVDGDKTMLTIGGEEVQLIYPGPNHEVGNILVHFPAQKLTVMTDLVMPGWAPYRGWGNADYPPGMLAAHDAILATDFDTYVGGHVYRTGTRRCRRRMIWSLTCFSLARIRFESVFRRIQNRPLRAVAQICVIPRNWNVSGFPSPRAARSRGGAPPELDQPGLVRVQFQAELREPLAQPGQERLGVLPVLEPDDEVVGEPHDDHITAGLAPVRDNHATPAEDHLAEWMTWAMGC